MCGPKFFLESRPVMQTSDERAQVILDFINELLGSTGYDRYTFSEWEGLPSIEYEFGLGRDTHNDDTREQVARWVFAYEARGLKWHLKYENHMNLNWPKWTPVYWWPMLTRHFSIVNEIETQRRRYGDMLVWWGREMESKGYTLPDEQTLDNAMQRHFARTGFPPTPHYAGDEK